MWLVSRRKKVESGLHDTFVLCNDRFCLKLGGVGKVMERKEARLIREAIVANGRGFN